MNKIKQEKFKSGFIAVIGRPNVGKSTLINKLIGQKISIVSNKPQTTRNKILGILSKDDIQIIFIDTPGMHKPKHKLGEMMMKAANSALDEVDLIIFVSDLTETFGLGEQYILDKLATVNTPVVLALNKSDKLKKANLARAQQCYTHEFVATKVVSALTGDGLPELMNTLKRYLPEGPQYYPSDMLTDQPERFVVSEIIREKIFRATYDEIPHSVAVAIEEMVTRKNGKMFVRAVIFVERDSQKAIIIGDNGKNLKEIGQLSRVDIEALLGNEVYLDLWVKAKKNWRNEPRNLHQFGYDGE